MMSNLLLYIISYFVSDGSLFLKIAVTYPIFHSSEKVDDSSDLVNVTVSAKILHVRFAYFTQFHTNGYKTPSYSFTYLQLLQW